MWVKFVSSLSEKEVISLGFDSVEAAIKYATELDEALGG